MTRSGSELNGTEKQDLEMMYGRTYFDMTNFCFLSINGPLIVLNLMANIFFVFCLMTRKTQRVKQPLKILLGFVVFSTILYLFSVALMYCVIMLVKSRDYNWACFLIVFFTVYVNMTSYVWLMFYYYIMIVPSQQALFLWVKKNIKSVIYVMLFVDRLMFLGYTACQIAFSIGYSRNPNGTKFVVQEFEIVEFSSINVYIFLCLCVMMVSSFATAHYLYKHMKGLAASGGSLFNPRLRSQIRVTVTGILQGVLYFLYALWFMVTTFCFYFPPYVLFDSLITYTVTSLYISVTTVNLGVGQTLFRERAVHVWKAVKKRLGTGKTSEDPRPAGNNLTSLATIESTGVDADVSL